MRQHSVEKVFSRSAQSGWKERAGVHSPTVAVLWLVSTRKIEWNAKHWSCCLHCLPSSPLLFFSSSLLLAFLPSLSPPFLAVAPTLCCTCGHACISSCTHFCNERKESQREGSWKDPGEEAKCPPRPSFSTPCPILNRRDASSFNSPIPPSLTPTPPSPIPHPPAPLPHQVAVGEAKERLHKHVKDVYQRCRCCHGL